MAARSIIDRGGILFYLDERIESTCFVLGDWPLSRVLLKNDQSYPWFLLVPRINHIQEIYQLDKAAQSLLMEEINQLSLLVKQHYQPDKLNVAALGNVVAQLHVHIVARSIQDGLWPQGIWQGAQNSIPYEECRLNSILPGLRTMIAQVFMNKV